MYGLVEVDLFGDYHQREDKCSEKAKQTGEKTEHVSNGVSSKIIAIGGFMGMYELIYHFSILNHLADNPKVHLLFKRAMTILTYSWLVFPHSIEYYGPVYEPDIGDLSQELGNLRSL
jgi:hypothetical protein